MAIHEAWLFEDDSVLVKFDNGCCLQLSSCGAVFQCFSPTNNVKSSSVPFIKETQQCSQFATTMWKDMVKQAIDFRNKFAWYPYLCYNLSEITATTEQHEVVNSCTWFTDDLGENINYDNDGSISITSKENNTTVILSACKQIFTVNFLCKIQTEKQNESEEPAYSWVKQIHSTNLLYPHCFHHAMSLLNDGTIANQNVKITSTVVSDLPQSLPQQCKKHHLHRWKSNWNAEKISSSEFMDGELIKVFYSQDVFYRFYYKKYLIAEVILPDGSVLRSTGPTHIYFKHWVYDSNSKNVKENVYSAKALPLNDRSSPIGKILNTVCRYLKYLSVCWKRKTTTLDCCWKNDNDSYLLDAERELEFSTYIRDQGSFKMYSNGIVRIVFCDGAIMDFNYPSEKKCKIRIRDDENCYDERFCEKHKTALVHDTGFTLILPNGISLKSSLDSPAGPYTRYVQIALDFIKWKQNHFQNEQRLDYENADHVYEELEKLRRFTSSDTNHNIVNQENNGLKMENDKMSNILSREAHLATSPLSQIKNVQGCLNDTRKTVDEIDRILQNCKRQLGKK